jgi:hypothetical protein
MLNSGMLSLKCWFMKGEQLLFYCFGGNVMNILDGVRDRMGMGHE